MKITFTPSGGAAQVLADLNAAPRITAAIEQFGGASVVQAEKRFGQATEIDFPRGNVGGQFIFTAECSYLAYAALPAALALAWSLLNAQGTVVCIPFQPDGTTLTMSNAVLHDVHRVAWDGVRLKLRYTFKITTVTSP